MLLLRQQKIKEKVESRSNLQHEWLLSLQNFPSDLPKVSGSHVNSQQASLSVINIIMCFGSSDKPKGLTATDFVFVSRAPRSAGGKFDQV